MVVASETPEEHLHHLRILFERLRSSKVRAKGTKAKLFRTSCDFLGHVIGADGVAPQQKKVETVANCPTPSSVSDIKAFLGLAGFYRKFIRPKHPTQRSGQGQRTMEIGTRRRGNHVPTAENSTNHRSLTRSSRYGGRHGRQHPFPYPDGRFTGSYGRSPYAGPRKRLPTDSLCQQDFPPGRDELQCHGTRIESSDLLHLRRMEALPMRL